MEVNWAEILDFNTAAPMGEDGYSSRKRKSVDECVREFQDLLRSHGLIADEIICDGRMQRLSVEGKDRKKKNGWYVFHADGVPAGSFGRWDEGEQVIKWCAHEESELTEEEIARNRYITERARKEREEKIEEDRINAAIRARKMWDNATTCETHPYLERKGVKIPGPIRVDGDVLLIPMCDGAKNLVNLQRIFPKKLDSGTDKLFLSGGKVQGTVFYPMIGDNATIAIGEGVATMATIHEATGWTCVATFTKHNLVHVAKHIRAEAKDAVIIITGDKDADGGGQKLAKEAADSIGARCFIPDITPDKGTDFNDLAAAYGLDEVKRQLATATDLKINPYDFASSRWDGAPKQTEWLVEPIFAMGKVSLFAAQGGAGKSMLVLDMAAKIALCKQGPPLLPGDESPTFLRAFGGDIVRHGPVVCYIHEDDSDEVHARLWNMGYRDYSDQLICITLQDTSSDLVMIQRDAKGNPERGPGYQEVDRHLAMIKPVLVVFDPLANFVMADIDKANEHAVYSMGAFANLARKHNCAVMCTHHFNKDGVTTGKGGNESRVSVRGATGLVDRARTLYTIYEMNKEKRGKLASAMGLDHGKSEDSFFCGVVAKTNLKSNKQIIDYYRNQNSGLLEEIPKEIQIQVSCSREAAEEIILHHIGEIAKVNPYSARRSSQDSMYGRRNEFDQKALAALNLSSRTSFDDAIKKWIDQGRLVQGAHIHNPKTKILDVCGGCECIPDENPV